MKQYLVVQMLGEYVYKEVYKTYSKLVAKHQLARFEKVYKTRKFKIIVLTK